MALVESESVRVLRRRGSLLITETSHGFICANAGIDLSNVAEGTAALLPVDPDRSARRLRADLRRALGVEVGVIISDTFGRTWREGVTDVAIGAAGLGPILDLRGTQRRDGPHPRGHRGLRRRRDRRRRPTWSWARPPGLPAAIVRGCPTAWLGDGSVGESIIRTPEDDLFR